MTPIGRIQVRLLPFHYPHAAAAAGTTLPRLEQERFTFRWAGSCTVASTRQEQLDQYNYFLLRDLQGGLLPRSTGHPGRVRRDHAGSDPPKFVTGNDPRTLNLHQSNLAEDALLIELLGEVLARFRQTTSAALVQPSLTESVDSL